MKILGQRKFKLILLSLVFGIFLFCFWNLAFTQDARLTNIIVTNTRDDLLIYLNIKGAFTDEVSKAVLSGVPTSFSVFITLYQARNMWFDKKMADLELKNTVKYNNLKKEFTIKQFLQNKNTLTVNSFDKAKNLMTEIDSLKIISLSALEKGKQYQIRVKARLNKLTLPFYLHYVLFFVSIWDFETDWYTIDFIY